MSVGWTTRRRVRAASRQGGREGEIYEPSARSATLRRPDPSALPAHPAARLRLQPRLAPAGGRRFNVARALVGTEGTCVTMLEMTVRLVHSPASARLVVLGYPDVYRAADHVMEVLAAHPIGLEGIDQRSTTTCARRAPIADTSAPACRSRLALRRVRRRHHEDGRRARPTRHGSPRGGARAPSMLLIDRPSERHLARARVGPRRDRVRSRRARHLAGLGGLGGRARAAGRVPARPPRLFEVRLSPVGLRAFRAGLRPLPHRLRPDHAPRHQPVPRLHGGGGRPRRQLRRLALGRARRRQSRAEFLPKMFGRSCRRLRASSRRSGIPTGR